MSEENITKLFNYINKHVQINLKQKTKLKFIIGWIYTVDPVSFSYVLVKCQDKKPKEVIIVMQDEIQDIKIINELNIYPNIELVLENLFENSALTNQDVLSTDKEKNSLIKWLKENHLPIKLEKNIETINILDTVFIKPPYREEDCESTNEIILDKVRNLVKNLPK